MKRIPLALQAFLVALTIGGLVAGYVLDLRAGDWVADHPITAGIASGTLTVPLTLLLAIYLVDYFVDREETRRREPLRVHWLQQIRKHSLLAIECGARSTWDNDFSGNFAEAHTAIHKAWSMDPRAMYDHRDAVPLPSNWKRFPLGIATPDGTAPRLVLDIRVAEEARRVLPFVSRYAETFGDPDCWLWCDLIDGDLSSLEGHATKHGQDFPPHLTLGVAEYLCALLIHLGLVRADEWPSTAGRPPQQAIPQLDAPRPSPSFRTALG